MDSLITRLTFLVIWINICALFIVSGKNVGQIGCRKTLPDYGCRSESCTGTCVGGCTDGGDIWGTALYTYDSPICRSAIHDLRISTWNNSARTVTFKYAYDIKSYLGSRRQDISTISFGKLSNSDNGYFYFQSPRVTEELLDIVSLHRNYLHDGGSHTQECHLSTNAINRPLFYSRYIGRDNLQPMFCKSSGPYSCWKMQWNESHADKVGGYWCRPNNSMLSGVLSIAMSRNAEFLPDTFTVTKSIGDSATIEMSKSNAIKYVYWYKDENKYESGYIDYPYYKAKLQFDKIKIGHAGIYNCHYSNYKSGGKIRLIVRVCENGIYGPLCKYNCPACQNGGICHDITGDCLCPPGFNGTYCENACEIGFFGKDCKQQCTDEIGNPINCNGIQFCLPDPYGCSCGSGYKTIACNQPCSIGFYGAGCIQSCSENCDSERSCHIVTGRCMSGCKDGWHGDRCVTSYPVFIEPPVILDSTENSIKVMFNEWKAINQNSGLGTPDSYLVQYKEEASSNGNWIDSDSLEANQTTFSIDYIYTIMDLLPDTSYVVRVVIIDSSGRKQLNNIPEATGRTRCGDPQQPPFDIKVDYSQSKKIIIMWKLPPKESWRCKELSTEISYNNSYQVLKNISTSQSFEFATEPYTEWYISLRSKSRVGYSLWSSLMIVKSAEDAPTEVRNVDVKIDIQQIFITWEEPVKKNGIIRYYIIKYKQVRWLHNCELSVNSSFIEKEINASEYSSYIAVRPSLEYELYVYAVTVKEGTRTKVIIKTKETVPGAPPEDFEIVPKRNKLKLIWKAPRCDLYNGRIIGYQYFVHAQEPWDSKQYNGSTTSHSVEIGNLIPFTTYNALVFAMTEVGVSNFSAHLNKTTLSDSPPSPSNLTVYHKTASILSISLKPPYPPKGKLEKYKVSYRCHNGCIPSKTFDVPVDVAFCHEEIRKEFHCITISHLAANQKYTITISALNVDVDQSGKSESVEGETKEAVPDPPQNGEIKNSTESSFNVVWEIPLNSNGNITTYRINITAIKSYNENVIGMNFSEVTSLNARSFEFQNLYPATVYNITVEASTIAGYGKPLVFESSTQNSDPVIDFEPILGEITSATAVLLIRPIEFKGGPISGYFIIVQYANKRKKRMIPEFKLVNYNTSLQDELDYYTAAKFLPEEIYPNGTKFIVGDGKFYNEFYNPPLKHGKSYKLGMAVLSNYNGEERIGIKFLSQEVRIADPPKMEGNHLTGIVIGILIALLLLTTGIIIVIAFRYPDLYAKMKKRANSKAMLKSQELISMSKDDLNADIETEQTPEPKSCRIAVSDLEDYVQMKLLNGEIRKQYVSLGKGQCQPSENAKKPENKLKNRYGNLPSYDNSRVVLEKLPNDPCSDYINANYVDGYKNPKRYIATQGPKPITVADFWRMIWQENVTKIIMSTNLIESGKTKCEKYWPDTSNIYGGIDVSLTHTEMYADYVIRTFHVKKGSTIREMKHFHFTTWPDHGVPMYTVAVANFVQKTRSYKPNDQSPIVVHCSAGIGRTGTLILIDAMLDMAAAEEYVDLISHLYIMRQQRINIVETLAQYCFVHEVLVDILCRANTAILCSEYLSTLIKFKEVNPSTGQTVFHQQFEKLAKLCPLLKSSDCRTGLELNNQPKNRNKDIVPPESACVILPVPENSPELQYINAVYVNGYRQKDSFIVTQIPLPETISDFWQMAYYSKASTIVLLNGLEPTDETCLPYWPENSDIYGGIQVHNIDVESHGEIQIRTFKLENMALKEEQIPKVIKQFHLTNWMPADQLPSSSDIILNLIEKVERWQIQSGTTAIVQCLNGVRACGLYCASVFICDKIKAEQEIDVFLAVRSIRPNRPQFIENVEQYIYCHQMALTFLDTFEIYANFQ